MTRTQLTGRGIALALPPGWSGRIGARGFPLPGAAIVHVANVPLPQRDDDWGSATLHRFGTKEETRALLGRLIRELRPPAPSAEVAAPGSHEPRVLQSAIA